MTFLSHSAVVPDILDNLHSTYFREPSIKKEIHKHIDDYPSNVPSRPCNDIDLGYMYPSYSVRITSDDSIQAQSFAFQHLPNDTAFYFTGYTNRGSLVESATDASIGSATSLADGYPTSYQATPRMFQMFQAPLPGPSEASYRSNPLAHSHVIQDPFHNRVDAVQSRITPLDSANIVTHPRDYPVIPPSYQVSSPFGDFSRNVAVVLPPSPPPKTSTVNEIPVTTPSNTIPLCRCSSACSAVLDGNIQAVRHHLKQVHQFRGAAKESIRCLWSGCKRNLQRENIPRHILTCHLRVTVNCPACGTALSRRDVQYTHARVCRARRHPSASRLRTDVSSSTAPSTDPTLSDRSDAYRAGMPMCPGSPLIPHAPFNIATTPGWATHTIPIAANTSRSSGHTLRVSIPPLGYSPYQPPVMAPGLRF